MKNVLYFINQYISTLWIFHVVIMVISLFTSIDEGYKLTGLYILNIITFASLCSVLYVGSIKTRLTYVVMGLVLMGAYWLPISAIWFVTLSVVFIVITGFETLVLHLTELLNGP